MKKKILVLCTGNSCRSQMAEGYLRYFAKNDADVFSAGIEAHGVNPRAIEVMLEDGIDISKHTSDTIAAYQHLDFDFIITVCDNANERCPYFAGHSMRFHHNFPDPAKATGTNEMVLQQFKVVRKMIKDYCEDFVRKNIHTAN